MGLRFILCRLGLAYYNERVVWRPLISCTVLVDSEPNLSRRASTVAATKRNAWRFIIVSLEIHESGRVSNRNSTPIAHTILYCVHNIIIHTIIIIIIIITVYVLSPIWDILLWWR